MTRKLKKILESYEYFNLKKIKGRGICGLQQYIYTVGLCYNLTEFGYEGRYCYPTKESAINAINNWNGKGDPQDEQWIKHKGEKEYNNPLTQSYLMYRNNIKMCKSYEEIENTMNSLLKNNALSEDQIRELKKLANYDPIL